MHRSHLFIILVVVAIIAIADQTNPFGLDVLNDRADERRTVRTQEVRTFLNDSVGILIHDTIIDSIPHLLVSQPAGSVLLIEEIHHPAAIGSSSTIAERYLVPDAIFMTPSTAYYDHGLEGHHTGPLMHIEFHISIMGSGNAAKEVASVVFSNVDSWPDDITPTKMTLASSRN